MAEILLRKDGYGTPLSDVPRIIVPIQRGDETLIHPLDVAYVALTGLGKVFDEEGNELDFPTVLSRILEALSETCKKEGKGCVLLTYFWSMFTTLYDLKSKNRKVLPEARREGTLLEIRKNRWWAEYLIMEEGTKVSMKDFLEWLEEVKANDLMAVVAVVDRNNDVTYYEVAEAVLKNPHSKRAEGQASSVSS